MRLRLLIHRNGVPPCSLTWTTNALGHFSTEESHLTATISEFLSTVNDIIPLESGEWGLEDYTVELNGQWECLHFQEIGAVFRDGDEVQVRPLTSKDLKTRRLSGRHQISRDGKRLHDGVVFGRRFIKVADDRPLVNIPPRKRARLTIESSAQENVENSAVFLSPRLLLSADAANEESDDEDDDEDFEVSSSSNEDSLEDSGLGGEDEEGNESDDGNSKEAPSSISSSVTSREAPVQSIGTKRKLRSMPQSAMRSSTDSQGIQKVNTVRNVRFDDPNTEHTLSKKRKLSHKLEDSLSLKQNTQLKSLESAKGSNDTVLNESDETSSSGTSESSESDSDSDSDSGSDPETDSDIETSSFEKQSRSSSENSSSSESENEPVSQNAKSPQRNGKDVATHKDSHPIRGRQSSKGSQTANLTHEKEANKTLGDLNLRATSPGFDAVSSKHIQDEDVQEMVAQPLVPPGSGSKATQKRRLRKRRKTRFNRLQEQGDLPPSADFQTWCRREYPLENDDIVVDSGRNLKDGAKIEELESKRQKLIAAIQSGGIEIDHGTLLENNLSTPASQMKSEEENVDNSELPPQKTPNGSNSQERQGPRMKLDIASSRRMLFGSLGIRPPKNTDSTKLSINEPVDSLANVVTQNGIGDSPIPIEQQKQQDEANGGQSPQSDSWKRKITLSAVECGEDNVILSTPPFPFVQRWDPQQQYHQSQHSKKAKSKNQRKRESKRAQQMEHEGSEHEEVYYESENIILDYDEPLGKVLSNNIDLESDEIIEAVNTQLLRDVNEAARYGPRDNEDTEADLPFLPTNMETLLALSRNDLTPDTVIAFKRLKLGKSYQPEISDYETAIITEEIGLDGMFAVRLADRDIDKETPEFDEQTGKRIYRKFEMPDPNEDEPDGNENVKSLGQEYLSFDQLIEPKLVISSPKGDKIGKSLSDLRDLAPVIHETSSPTTKGPGAYRQIDGAFDGSVDPSSPDGTSFAMRPDVDNVSSPIVDSPKFHGFEVGAATAFSKDTGEGIRASSQPWSPSELVSKTDNPDDEEIIDSSVVLQTSDSRNEFLSSDPMPIKEEESILPTALRFNNEEQDDDDWFNPGDASSIAISISSAEMADHGNQGHEMRASPETKVKKEPDPFASDADSPLHEPFFSTARTTLQSEDDVIEQRNKTPSSPVYSSLRGLGSAFSTNDASSEIGYDESLPRGPGWVSKGKMLRS